MYEVGFSGFFRGAAKTLSPSTTGEGYFGPTLKQSSMEISTFIKGGMGDWDHKWLQPANEEDNVIDLGYLSPLPPNRINKCMIYLLKF